MEKSDIKILIADDVKLNIILVQKALSFHPFQVFTALGGEEALAIIDRERPHILLLDLMMPDIDGFEIIRRVREGKAGDPNAKIIILSALNSPDDREEGLKAGANDYITKPIILPAMMEAIEAQINEM